MPAGAVAADRRRRLTRPGPALAAALGLFGAVAGLHLAAPRLDSDQAVTGLMGVYILRGDFPIVFWGQHHAGVPESYAAAVAFFALGVSRFALSLVPAVAALGLLLLVYRTGRLLFGARVGVLAVVFTTVVSPYVFSHYVRARSYYVEHLLLGQVVLLGAALWLARGPALTPAARARSLVAIGLAGGLGFYCGFQIADALLPAVAALLVVDRRLPLRREAWLGAGAFLLGSLPFWLYNATHDWATFAVGVRFQGRESAREAALAIVQRLLPVVLGAQDSTRDPAYLPWPASLVAPLLVAAAVVWILVRVLRGIRRLPGDPARAGEALLVLVVVATIGLVWFGRFTRVPRYLVPLAPVLALLLARACQLAWRRAPALAAAGTLVYLAAVGIPLVRDLTLLWPASRTAYVAERRDDERLFDLLRKEGLTRAYAFEYWLAPRLTFDAGAEIVVAEPWNDRYPPHAAAVDASPRPAYVLRGDQPPIVRGWLQSRGVAARESHVGAYTVVHDFTAPPAAVPLPRAGWAVRAGEGRGVPASVVDARIETGWTTALRAAPRSGWLEVDLGAPRPVSGAVLVTVREDRLPVHLEVLAEDPGRQALKLVGQVKPLGVTVTWANEAPRVHPGRTLTVRFPPVTTQRLRLVAASDLEHWSVMELFLLAPPGTGPAAATAPATVADARQREAAGRDGAALVRYHDALREAPDDPAGYEGFARLIAALQAAEQAAPRRAARLAALGLVDEARATYAEAAARLGPEVTHAELARDTAHLAQQAGDLAAASRLAAAAAAVQQPARATGAVLGRLVELTGYDVAREPVRTGEVLELTSHWRLLGSPARPLMAWWHLRGEGGRFADDYPLPGPLGGFAGAHEHVSVRRRIPVPPGVPPGRYRIVAGVWDPVSQRRLRVFWGGLVPTLDTAITVGTVEVLGPP